jgi:hypothetical protein
MSGNVGRFCFKCGRAVQDATDEDRWQRFFSLQPVVVDRDHTWPLAIDDAPCEHRDIEQDDDGLNNRFYVCTECHRVVVPTAPDEDRQVYWETLE